MKRRSFKKVFYGYNCERVDEMLTTKLQEFEEENEGLKQLSILLNLLNSQLSAAKARQVLLYKASSHAEEFPDYLQEKARNIAQDILREAHDYVKKRAEEGIVVDNKIKDIEIQLTIVSQEINNILVNVAEDKSVVPVKDVKVYNADSSDKIGAKVYSFADFLTVPVYIDTNTDSMTNMDAKTDATINTNKKQDCLLDDALVNNCIEEAGNAIVEAVIETVAVKKKVDKLEVLVVEDDESIRRLLVSILEREGFAVSIAVDGYEAIQCIDTMTPTQLVLLDSLLPYKSGLQVLKHLRSTVVWQRAIVVMMMDHFVEKDMIAAIKNGADDSIQKPFNPHEMMAKLRRLIQRQREA